MGHGGWPLVPVGLDVEVVAAGHGDISGCRFEVRRAAERAADPGPHAGVGTDPAHGGRESRR
ncbi:hypothetical protein OYE22_24585 [Streptomyces sp. 71268]|uniref:hypothetical protein n=1 Tax=Streptomyces sp. 71268 TaxID=3002640 RepID=UPI0023F61F0C|nr:hypothetical protein [Streptomyces sp. 71268]WEV27994.1 hypothetical protein OYE22_24585 [Streptomyces sp. 71268]